MNRQRVSRVGTFWLGLLLAGQVAHAGEPRGEATIDFDRQVRPILSNHCFQCHGPDADERQAELRLDIREEALRPAGSGKPAIVPGDAARSTVLKRIFSTRKGVVMPPPESNKPLSAEQKGVLRAWIEQGAKYQVHWSFTAPRRPESPLPSDPSWVRNPIDRFILARLDAERLRPAPEADRTTLIRRLSLDLTGLPPTPAEVDAFLADRRPDAYERLVDRLLVSPHHGERLALDWLDAARFADTHGYHIDSGRDMTRWREWVIDAFSRNLPFDRFTVEQLAGDLLPAPTLSQRIASGFNRNHMINFEGGAIPEEYQTAYVIDRVNTTGTVWLGLTIGCAQCHDHKFDPISQHDYYRFYAFFNNVPENGLDGRTGNAEPTIKSPSADQQRELDAMATALREAEQQLAAPRPEADALQARWEASAAARTDEWVALEPDVLESRGGARLARQGDGSIVVSGPNPPTDRYTIVAPARLSGVTAVRLEALPDDRQVANGPGRSVNGNIVLTEVRLAAAGPLTIRAASADFSQVEYPVAQAIDGQPATGWAIYPEVGKPHSAIFELARPLSTADGDRLSVSLEFQSPFSGHQCGKFRLSVTTAAQPREPGTLPQRVRAILALPSAQRNDAQASALRTYYRTEVSAEGRALNERIATLKRSLAALEKAIPSTMVMRELPRPRDTFMLVRGQYDKHGAKVEAGVPASLPPLPPGIAADRLGLARWLVDGGHPLTARVAVNRYWQMIFGTGLVKTAEDFGAQGELPSHPELLDWLAVEFQRGWDIRALLRRIVTSATYRQSSVVSTETLARDPENRLLARAPRLRLQAEFIRDQALAVGGLLDPRVGGASVSPYQPPGLWEELASRLDGKNWTAQSYTQSHGRDLYRRTMYTFWKRTSPPPTLATFDAPDRETCTVRRARTNTPLQALVLLNDPTYVEASRTLAERMMTEGGATAEERIAFAFRLAIARLPSPAELGVLKRLFDDQSAAFAKDVASALKLLAVGESARNPALDPAELAAWSLVAGAILNLDETVTKG